MTALAWIKIMNNSKLKLSDAYFGVFFIVLLFFVFSSNQAIVHAIIFTNFGLFLIFLMLGTIVGLMLKFEEKEYSSKELALIGMLSGLSAVSRIPFAAFPNIQPCTFIIIVSGLVFGPLAGFMVGCITPFASNAFLGQGPWTVLQMFSWGIIGWISGYFGRFFKEGMKEYFKSAKYRLILSIYAAICGFVYGVIADIWFAFSFYPLEEKFWIMSMLAGLGFNLAHAIGNFLFSWVLGSRFIQILMRFKRRMHFEIID